MSPWIPAETLTALSSQWIAILGDVCLRGLALLLLAVALDRLLRRQAAAARHLLWTFTVLALLLLPLFSLLPGWAVRGLPDVRARIENSLRTELDGPGVLSQRWSAPATELVRTDGAGPDADPLRVWRPIQTSGPVSQNAVAWLRRDEPAHAVQEAADRSFVGELRRLSWPVWTFLLWELGALVVLAVHLIGVLRLRGLENGARPVDDPAWSQLLTELCATLGLRRRPRLLTSSRAAAPMTWGYWRPAIVLPACAQDWSEEQRRNVLLHELEHVRRGDVCTQAMAQLACVLLWMHPLPWIAAGRMRLERERACDDRVLLAGSRASTYAGHLLEMARSLRSSSPVELATVGMARRAQLGERVQSLLEFPARPRILGPRGRALALTLALLLVGPLAILEAAPRETPTAPAAPTAPRPGEPRIVEAPPAPALAPSAVPRAPAPPSLPPLRIARLDLGTNHQWSWNSTEDGGERLRVEIEGRMRLSDTGTDVEWMEPGARLELEHDAGDERRRMVLEGRTEGDIERRFWIGRQRREIDEEARVWFAELMGRFATQTGINAEDRVRQRYVEGGIGAVLGEIEGIDSSHARAIHLSTLLEMDELSPAERARALRAIEGSVESDFQKAQILAVVLRDRDLDRRETEEVLVLVDGIDSDFEKSRVLAHLFENPELSRENIPALLETIHDIDSDFEKVRALAMAAPHCAGDAELEEAYMQIADEIRSEFEYGRAMRQLRAHGD
jgi:beta-lactamase regulating signal transducer with metallopeptidase domain